MAKKQTQKVTNWKPHAKQIKMVELLLNPEDRRPKTKKCEDVGVARKTFYRWMKDPRFVEYLNSRIDEFTNSELYEVWKALLMQCKRGNVQAIKLFFEMKELAPPMQVKQEVTGKEGGPLEIEVTLTDED